MANKFVEYLNSMNNVDGHSANALAESQINNDFYKEIKVERNIAEYIKKSIELNEEKTFIITGHAGDGKTSILAQILTDLDLLEGEKLSEYDVIDQNGKKLFYVKDMSELTQEKQEELIREALNLSGNGGTSILISNTGPLLNTIKKIDINKESEVLEQLDLNSDKEIEIANKKVTIINLARIENINFVDSIIDNLIKNKLWINCEECGKSKFCHISSNIRLIKNNKERIKLFLKSYYRWLSENDKRLTIRQMMAHISFAITANKKCENIKEISNSDFYYRHLYNISNNLFGFSGITENSMANQVRAIELIKELKIDSIALDVDYDLFIKNDFSIFPKEIKDIIEIKWKNFEIEFGKNIGDKLALEKARKIRRCIRRYYLLFGYYNKKDLSKVKETINEIFGEKFIAYDECILSNKYERNTKEFLNIVFDGLFKINVGNSNKMKDLYITLGKQNSRSSVKLIIGEVRKKDLEVKLVNKTNIFDDVDIRNEIYLMQKRSKKMFKLSYQLIDYFNSINKGAIDTKASPRITCGIDKLNSWLLKDFKIEEDGQIRLLVKNFGGYDIQNIEIDKNKSILDITEG